MACSSSMVFGKTENCNIVGNTQGGCGSGGPGECNVAGLSPRRNRGKVIDEIKDYVLMMLGAPAIDIELDEQQLNMAVNQTLKILEYYAPREYFKYSTFPTTPGKSIYEMPTDVGYVRDVSYKEMPNSQFMSTELGGSIPIEYFYPGGAYSTMQGGMIDPVQPMWGNMGSWSLYSGYSRMFAKQSGALGGWEFIGGYRHIKLYPIPYNTSFVIVQYIQRCMDWNDTVLMMQEGAWIHARIMLGSIRKKFQGSFGPSGGFSLDGESMYQEAKADYKEWKEQLLTHWGDGPGISMA